MYGLFFPDWLEMKTNFEWGPDMELENRMLEAEVALLLAFNWA